MIEQEAFPGDTDDNLKSLQNLFHFDLLRHLEETARKRYLKAAGIVGLENECVIAMRGVHYLSPLPLERSYAIIAAYFRCTNPQTKQMELGQDGASHWEALKIAWVRFYESEVLRLTNDGEITRCIVQAMVYAGTDMGRQAQDRLECLIEDHYQNLEGEVSCMTFDIKHRLGRDTEDEKAQD